MKILGLTRSTATAEKLAAPQSALWSRQRFSFRTYSLVVVGLLLLSGGVLLFAASPANLPGNSSITVSQGAAHSISQDFLGFNGDVPTGAINNPALLPAVKSLNAETIRGIVAGTVADYTNWQTGQYFITSNQISYIKPGQPTPPFTLSNYVNLLKTNNAAGVFNLNVMTYCPVSNTNPASTSQAGVSCTQAQACGPAPSTYTTTCTNTDPTWGLNYQIAMLKAAQAMGVQIKYVELGNELDETGGNVDYAYYFPTPQSYVNKVNAWIPVLKQDFPGVQVAIVGGTGNICQHAPNQTPNSAEPIWDKAVLSGVHGEDGVVFHTYYVSNLPSGGSVRSPSDLSTLLSTATQSCFSNLQNYRLNLLPSGVSAWITEWNLWIDNGVLEQGSWAQGLTEASYALDLARDPRIALADNHDLVGQQTWGALFVNSGSYLTTVQGQPLVTPSTPPPTTQQFGMTGGGFALSTLERSMHGATSTAALNFSSNPSIAGTSVPGLVGQSFNVGGKTNLYFANLSANAETLNLGSLSGNYSGLQYSSSPATFPTGSSSIPATSLTATTTVSIPAYSVTSLVSTGSAPPPPPPPPLADTTPPTVSLATPAKGATLSGTVAVSATASDNVGVTNVQLELDGKPLGAALTTAPYAYSWNTLGASNGAHTLSATAADAAGNTSVAASTTVTVHNLDTQAPTVPSGLTATVPTSAAVNLSWQPSTDNVGVVSYSIYRNGATTPLTSVTPPTTSYVDTTVSADTHYTYTITALDAAGNRSAQSTAVGVDTPANPDRTPPSVPQQLTGKAVSQTSIALSWQPSTDSGGSGLAGYHLYRNGVFIASSATTAYTDTALMSGTQYTYTVSAYDKAANGSVASAAVRVATQGVSPDHTPPSVPNDLHSVLRDKTQTSITLAWNASIDSGGSGLAGYKLYRNDVLIASPRTNSYVDKGLSVGTAYHYYAVAVDNAGNTSAHHPALNVATKHPWWQIWK